MGIDDRRGKPIDTRRFFVVCINSLGSPFGSSSPLSIDPASGRPYGTAFPLISVEDIASAAREALRALGIERVACVIGPSLGGMTVLAYWVQFPARGRRADLDLGRDERFAVRDRAALAAARDRAQRPGVAQRRLRARSRAADRAAAGAQARHDHLPWRAGVRHTLRPAAGRRARRAGRRTTSLRGRVLSRAPGAAFLGGLRRELLPVPFARDGRVRSRRAWRARSPRRSRTYAACTRW